MIKRVLSIAFALVLCFAVMPFAAMLDTCGEMIKNDFGGAIPIAVGEKVQVGEKATGPSYDTHICYNVEMKYVFTVTEPSMVTITISTEKPGEPKAHYHPNFLHMMLRCADTVSSISTDRDSSEGSVKVNSTYDLLSDTATYKILPGTYYIYMSNLSTVNGYGWIRIDSITTMPDDFGGEPNDTIAQALENPAIATGVEYKGNIGYDGKKREDGIYSRDALDYYKFEVPHDGYNMKITASRADTWRNNHIWVYLRDDYGYTMSGEVINLYTAVSGELEFRDLKKGLYFVCVESRQFPPFATEYTFRLDTPDGGNLGVIQFPSSLVAKPTASRVLVNGENVQFDAYNINGNNYFKLRDIAFVLNGTAKQFNVVWDGANNAISLTSGQQYTVVGGEMTGKGVGDKKPTPTNSKIIMDGKEVQFTAYNIEGNNYFKLRDIGAAFDFGVDWDGMNNTIVIDTSKGYTPE